MSEPYDIVPRPKAFRSGGGGPEWPIDAILATVSSGDAIRIPHASHVPTSGDNRNRKNERGYLLAKIREGLKRRGYALEWAPDPDSPSAAVIVWAVRLQHAAVPVSEPGPPSS